MKFSPLYFARIADSAYGRNYDGLPPIVWQFQTTEHIDVRHLDSLGGKLTILGIRGSDDRVDWARNIDFELVPYVNGLGHVHDGLQRAYFEISGPTIARLKNTDRLDGRIIIVAHSHGCPPACFLADELMGLGANDVEVVNFGSPNSCDEEAAAHISAGLKITNYCAGWIPIFRDPVPHLPYWMNRPGYDIILPGRFGAIRNHAMKNYIRLLG